MGASRAFANEFFGGNYQYAFVQHTFDTDPDKNPSRNPHVHVVVKVRGKDGTRLSPKKADLYEWREAFARGLRERGIEAVATRRKTRFERSKGEPQALRRLRDRHGQGRGGMPDVDSTAPVTLPAVKEKARRDVRALVKDYFEIAKVLAASPEREDKILATELAKETLKAAKREGLIKQRDRGNER